MSAEIDLVKESTVKEMLVTFKEQTAFLGIIARNNFKTEYTDKEIQEIVDSGLAPYIFNIGDQLEKKWKDVAADVEYDCPLDIVGFLPKTLEDGEVLPGMQLQLHWATPFGLAYDEVEAFFANVTTEALPAGDYHFNLPTKTGETPAGDYTFTAPEALPAGGQLRLPTGWYANAWQSLTITAFASPSDKEPLWTAALTAGSAGTDLGGFGDEQEVVCFNKIGRSAYGSNKVDESSYQQWLDSDELNWWKPQNVWDRIPSQAGVKYGFLSGFDEGFKAILRKTKTTTAYATIDVVDGVTTVDTYNFFRLPSLEQIYTAPQLENVEGPYLPYWKRALGLTQYSSHHPAKYEAYKFHPMNSHGSTVYVRLRSASRSTTTTVWYVTTSGSVNTTSPAYPAYAAAPVCDI